MMGKIYGRSARNENKKNHIDESIIYFAVLTNLIKRVVRIYKLVRNRQN